MNLIKALMFTVTACMLLAGCNLNTPQDSEWLNFTDLQSESEAKTESLEQSVSGTGECVKCIVDDGLTTIDVDNETTAYLRGIEYLGAIIVESKFTDELQYGDLVETVNGIKIEWTEDVERALENSKAGDIINVTVLRRINEEDVRISVQIALREKIPDSVNFD